MAQSDFWSEGRILIAGDSRVRRLMSNPDPLLAGKTDYAFEGGVLIKDLVTLVDDNLNDHHKVVILFGMVGDEVQKYIHHVTSESSVSLIRSKESDASEQILVTVKESTAKWMSQRSERMVLWMVPHYVDYLSYNTGKLGEFDVGDALEISLDSSRRFVNFITRLKLRWVADCPEVPFGLLNRVLFAGKKSKEMYKSFSAVSAADYKFPTHLLTDGLHPTAPFAKDVWRFLHKSVSDVHDRLMGKETTSAPSISSVDSNQLGKSIKKQSYKFPKHTNIRLSSHKPYVPKKINLARYNSNVHERLSLPQSGDGGDEEFQDGVSVGSYKNLSWRASTSASTKGSSVSAPLGFVQRSPQWSWAIHNQRINAVKTEVYTQGLESQKRAEGRLADIIRDRGLRLAELGQLDTVNAASRSWLTNLHAEMNSPAPDAKLVQKEMAALLPVEGDKSSSSDTD